MKSEKCGNRRCGVDKDTVNSREENTCNRLYSCEIKAKAKKKIR